MNEKIRKDRSLTLFSKIEKEQSNQKSDEYKIEEEIRKSLQKYDPNNLEKDLGFDERARKTNFGIKYLNISKKDQSEKHFRVPSFSKLKLNKN